jgi:N-acetylglucosaminyl-diphospho-decaprenol L-rhamnosyltransferase
LTLDVVIVSYRSARKLETSLPSLRSFAPNGRMIVIDNSPGDGAGDVARRLAPGATVIANEENRGFASAVNQALRAGTGDIVLLANPDVCEARGHLSVVMDAFATDPHLGALAARLINPDGSLQHSCRRIPHPFDLVSETLALHTRFPRWQRPQAFRMLDWDYRCPRYVVCASGAFLFLRRAAFADVGQFDERFFLYWEEADWLVRAKAKGWKTLYLPAIEAVHESGASSDESETRLSLLLLENQHRYARKHFQPAVHALLRMTLFMLDSARWLRVSLPGVRSATSPRTYASRLRIHLQGGR